MSTSALLQRHAAVKQEQEHLENRMPFFTRIKVRYWGTKEKAVLLFGLVKAAVVATLLWGKAAWALFAVKFPLAAAVIGKVWAKLVALAVGAGIVAFGS